MSRGRSDAAECEGRWAKRRRLCREAEADCVMWEVERGVLPALTARAATRTDWDMGMITASCSRTYDREQGALTSPVALGSLGVISLGIFARDRAAAQGRVGHADLCWAKFRAWASSWAQRREQDPDVLTWLVYIGLPSCKDPRVIKDEVDWMRCLGDLQKGLEESEQAPSALLTSPLLQIVPLR